jgi:hypothetical protein
VHMDTVSLMKWVAVTSLIAALSLVADLAEPSDTGADCSALAESSVKCHQALWARFAAATPTTLNDLEVLLDAMWEGIKEGEDPADFGCPAEASEECHEECMPLVWQAFVDVVKHTSKPHERWGAMTIAFGTYMDGDPPADASRILEAVALDFLERPRDPTSTAAVLRMMKFYRFDDPHMISRLLACMESEPVLVRELAFQRFTQYSRCTLQFHPEAGVKKRAKEMGRIRRWWSTEGPPEPKER